MPSGVYVRSPATKAKMSVIAKARKDETGNNWKGDDAKYSALHKWVVSWKGKPEVCQSCGEKKIRMGWANKDHNYKRVLDDYTYMCPQCHTDYDKEHGLRNSK